MPTSLAVLLFRARAIICVSQFTSIVSGLPSSSAMPQIFPMALLRGVSPHPPARVTTLSHNHPHQTSTISGITSVPHAFSSSLCCVKAAGTPFPFLARHYRSHQHDTYSWSSLSAHIEMAMCDSTGLLPCFQTEVSLENQALSS